MNSLGSKHRPSGNRARIYCAGCGTAIPDCLERDYLAMMPPRTRAAIAGYKRRQDRQATLFGKLLLLKALRAAYPDAALHKLQLLDAAESGKPFIPGAPGFSISHSGEVVVLAVAGDGEIGIDIEKIREVDIDDFSRDLPEIANLRLHYDQDRIRGLFFDCWTRKEAVLKGCGKGLSVPLTRVMLKERTALLHDTTWFIEKVRIEDAYCCHVATERPLEHVAVERVNLMNGWV